MSSAFVTVDVQNQMLLKLDLCDLFFCNVYNVSLISKVSNNPRVVKHFLISLCREVDSKRHEMLPKDFIYPSFLLLHILCSSSDVYTSLLVSHLAPELWLEGISATEQQFCLQRFTSLFFNCFFPSNYEAEQNINAQASINA